MPTKIPTKKWYSNPFRRKQRQRKKSRTQAWNKETPSEYLRRNGLAERQRVKDITNLLIRKNGSTCAICGKLVTNKKELTLDHIKPKSKGGQTVLENCQLACWECNQKKGNKY